MILEKCTVTSGYTGETLYLNKLVIGGVDCIKYYPSLMQRIKTLFGLYPTSEYIELLFRVHMFSEKFKQETRSSVGV